MSWSFGKGEFSERTDVKLATFIDPAEGMTPRLGIAVEQGLIDVRAAAEALHRAVPASDLIAMGAPKGVAMGQPNAAELYLKPGDRMGISLEGLMTLRTTIAAPPAS